MVSKIMSNNSDVTSKHWEWFKGGRQSVYKERVFVLQDILFFSLYSFSSIAKPATTLEIFRPCHVSSLQYELRVVVVWREYHLPSTPPVTDGDNCDGDDGDDEVGDGDRGDDDHGEGVDGNGDDGDGDGVSDSDHSTWSTFTSRLAMLMLASKLPQI